MKTEEELTRFWNKYPNMAWLQIHEAVCWVARKVAHRGLKIEQLRRTPKKSQVHSDN